MKNLKINKLTDGDNDLLLIEVRDEHKVPAFVLAYNEKTGDTTIKFPLEDRIASFPLDEFQQLVDRLKNQLHSWAADVADKN